MQHQNGSTVLLVMTIVFATLTVGLGGFSIWAFLNYQEQKNNVDGIVSTEVTQAQEEQKAVDEASFLEREKLPVRQFVGPADLGQVTFDFPKTWSVYIAEDGTSGLYNAYYHPGAVVNPSKLQAYALRLVIVDSPYETTLSQFQQAVQDGTLKASAITIDGETGTRFDGAISAGKIGSLVLLKSRDKTIEIYTEAPTYLNDFNNIILPSLKFNP